MIHTSESEREVIADILSRHVPDSKYVYLAHATKETISRTRTST